MGECAGDIHALALIAAARMSLFRSCKEVQGSPSAQIQRRCTRPSSGFITDPPPGGVRPWGIPNHPALLVWGYDLSSLILVRFPHLLLGPIGDHLLVPGLWAF